MRANFHPAIANLREWEGINSCDSDDPGDETVFGIARAFHPNIPWPPTWEQAKEIYLTDYWLKGGCDLLPFPMDVIHFDSCVNPGPGASMEFLKQSSEHKDPNRRAVEYLDLRLRYYLGAIRKRPVAAKYLAGWMDRSLDILERTVITSWSMEA